MKLSTKGRYAVIAMLDLALHDKEGPVTLTDISMAQSISLSYLEQLFAKLRCSGLVEGVRGPGGGYRLARTPNQISIAEVIVAVDKQGEENQVPEESSIDPNKHDTGYIWHQLSRRLYQFLDAMTLDQFIPQPDVKQFADQQNEESRRMNFMQPPPASLSSKESGAAVKSRAK